MRSVQVEPVFGFNGPDMIIQNGYKAPWVLILIDIENGAVLFSSSMTQWKFHYLWEDLGEASFQTFIQFLLMKIHTGMMSVLVKMQNGFPLKLPILVLSSRE